MDRRVPTRITFKVIRETPCGYWISPDCPLARGSYMAKTRWVREGSGFACKTPEAALKAFYHRKRSQLRAIERRHEQILEAVQVAWDQLFPGASPYPVSNGPFTAYMRETDIMRFELQDMRAAATKLLQALEAKGLGTEVVDECDSLRELVQARCS